MPNMRIRSVNVIHLTKITKDVSRFSVAQLVAQLVARLTASYAERLAVQILKQINSL
jgi:hypothetical protein